MKKDKELKVTTIEGEHSAQARDACYAYLVKLYTADMNKKERPQ